MLSSLNAPENPHGVVLSVPILQMHQLRHRAAGKLAQGHQGSEFQSGSSSAALSQSLALTVMLKGFLSDY